MRSAFRGVRGKLSPGIMLAIAAAAVAAAAGVWWWSQQRTEGKKRENIGKVGAASTFKLAREPGINLPFADQAVAATASPDTTVEIPVEWGGDVKGAGQKLTERYDAIEKKLTRSGEVFDEVITLRIDRDLEYRMLYLAVSTGVERGFLKFNVACHPSGESREVRFLPIQPPAEFKIGKNNLLWRIFRDGDRTCYAFGVSQVKKTYSLKAATGALKSTTWDADKVLVLGPELNISVQNVIEALNSGIYAGAPKITLNLTKVE